MRPPAVSRFAQATQTVPSIRDTATLGKLFVRKFAPGIGSAMSLTGPTIAGRLQEPPPFLETATTWLKPCSQTT